MTRTKRRLSTVPASRWQPYGVHGASRLHDPLAYEWKDDAWTGRQLAGSVLYELHVGTFTPQGTFEAAIEHLPALRDLGVTAIEVMPVAEFPGAVVTVSHDRYLLDRLCDRILEVRDGEVRSFDGGYDDWVAAKAAV